MPPPARNEGLAGGAEELLLLDLNAVLVGAGLEELDVLLIVLGLLGLGLLGHGLAGRNPRLADLLLGLLERSLPLLHQCRQRIGRDHIRDQVIGDLLTLPPTDGLVVVPLHYSTRECDDVHRCIGIRRNAVSVRVAERSATTRSHLLNIPSRNPVFRPPAIVYVDLDIGGW